MSIDNFSLLGQDIPLGTEASLQLDIAKLPTRNSIQVPVLVERAKKPGPVLLLMAGVHGDEINGVEIVRRLLHQKLMKPDSGTVIYMPVYNVFGFINLSRKFPDGRDLNRVFPGTEQGSLASQFAYQFTKRIAPFVDYVIDFHTGGGDKLNIAQTRCVLTDEKTLGMAKAFGAPFLVHSPYIPKSVRATFAKLGKPSLLFEGGKSQLYSEDAIDAGVVGAQRVLRHLGMKDGEMEPFPPSKIITKSRWVRAPQAGMFHLKVKNGSFVKKKTVIGTITDPFGEFEKKVFAPHDCHIICVNIAPIVNKGDALFHVSVDVAE